MPVDKGEFSPFASFLEFSEDVSLIIDDIRVFIVAGIVVMILTAFRIADLLFPFLPVWLNWFISAFWIVFTIALIIIGVPIYRNLSSWGQKFLRTSYFMKFKLLPADGENVHEQLFNKIIEVYLRNYKKLEKLKNYALFTNVKMRGKKKDHVFDVFLGEYVSEEGYVVARIFDKVTPVTSIDLSEFREEIIDALSLPFYKMLSDEKTPFRIVVLSKSSFSASSLEYVKEKENWIYEKSFDLIEQRNNEYDVKWIA